MDKNGFWSGFEDTDQYTWTVHDNSELNGKVGIFVTAAEGYAFPESERVRWTKVQDSTRCDAVVPAVTTEPTVCSVTDGVQGFDNGSVVHGEGEGVKSAYVFDTVGGTLVNITGQIDSLPDGSYTAIVTAEDGFEFTVLPEGWEYSKGPLGKAKVATTVVIQEGELNCSPLIPLEPSTPIDPTDEQTVTVPPTSDAGNGTGGVSDEHLPRTGFSGSPLLFVGGLLVVGLGLMVLRRRSIA